MSPRKIGSVILVLVLAHLFAPAAHALLPSGSLALIEVESFIPAAWEWLVSLVSPGEPELQRIREKAGSSMDPDGCPQNNTEVGSLVELDGNK